MPSRAARIGLVAVGIALLVGGGAVARVGVAGLGTCGGTVLVADAVDGPDDPDAAVAFENLTAARQDLAKRAIDGDEPAVESADWPWFESALLLRYRGEYYRFYTVTTECSVPPALVAGVGAAGVLAGLGALGSVGRTVLGDSD